MAIPPWRCSVLYQGKNVRQKAITAVMSWKRPIRRAIYTTNAIESLSSTVRRAIRTRRHFPNDRAATKLIYVALRGVERKWRAPPVYWHAARTEFSVHFRDRFALESA